MKSKTGLGFWSWAFIAEPARSPCSWISTWKSPVERLQHHRRTMKLPCQVFAPRRWHSWQNRVPDSKSQPLSMVSLAPGAASKSAQRNAQLRRLAFGLEQDCSWPQRKPIGSSIKHASHHWWTYCRDAQMPTSGRVFLRFFRVCDFIYLRVHKTQTSMAVDFYAYCTSQRKPI